MSLQLANIFNNFCDQQGAGKSLPLDEQTGIDILGNMVEATDLSVNKTFYGNLHGFGHDLISFIHDPDGRYLEDFSVMGHVATAMRDPGEHSKQLIEQTFTDYRFDKLSTVGIRSSTPRSSDIRPRFRNIRPTNWSTTAFKSRL